jgi:chitodextrinase
VQPGFATPNTITTQCILKSTATNANPTVILNPNAVDPDTGKPLYSPDELVTVVNKGTSQTFAYTYNVNAYVESYNFLRVLGGVANVVFSS